MKLLESEYKELRNDPRIKEWIDDWLINLINTSSSERMEANRSSIRFNKKSLDAMVEKINSIRSMLTEDPELFEWLSIGIDRSNIDEKLSWLKEFQEQKNNQRASSKKGIFHVLWIIFNSLDEMGWGQTKQIDFIFRIYKENKYENYADAKDDNQIKALRERIRKDQEKAVKKHK